MSRNRLNNLIISLSSFNKKDTLDLCSYTCCMNRLAAGIKLKLIIIIIIIVSIHMACGYKGIL